MEALQKVGIELKSFLSSNKITKLFLPVDFIFLFGGVALLALNQFTDIGTLLYSIAYYAFYFGLILTLANFNKKYLYIGMFIYAAVALYDVLRLGIFEKYINYLDTNNLVTAVIFGFLGYLVFRADTASKK